MANMHNTEDTHPNLSVIIVPLVGHSAVARCLDLLSKQQDSIGMEIIIPYSESQHDLTRLQDVYPSVRLLSFADQKTYAELRSAGVRNALGDILAITEDHCQPAPDWCEQIMIAHQQEYAAIGGIVEKELPDSALNWAIYFADYLRYSMPQAEGSSRSLTDLNVSYKRSAIDEISGVWADEFHENAVHDALSGRGETLWLSPAIMVNQQRSFSLAEAIRDRYAFGRLFASTRVGGAPASKRVQYLLFSIFVPVLLIFRILGLMRARGRWMGQFIRSLPAIILISLVWGYGEFIGYLTRKADPSLTPKDAA